MNNRTQHRPEIIAPAGTPEGFTAALDAGADAVYMGATDFNMRAQATRFRPGVIRDMIARAHDRGVKVNLAVNVLAFDDEIRRIGRVLDDAAEFGADAVIAWDPAVIAMARERELRVHLSTQASVANRRAVEFYAAQGVRRIVLARELNLEQIKRLTGAVRAAGIDMEFEAFVHGAMCVAVSGRCMTSWFQYGRSANRGDCLQPCRRPYRVMDITDPDAEELVMDGHTIMSARDMCTIGFLDRIADAGITAFKIEGRMRDPQYVATTVSCYREARDAILDGSWTPELAERLERRLSEVFNRGFSSGFYLGTPSGEAISDTSGSSAQLVRNYAGRVVKYYKRAGAADIQLEARGMAVGDRLLITGPTTGALDFIVPSMRSEDNRDIATAGSRELIGIAVPERVRRNDRVFVLEQRNSAG